MDGITTFAASVDNPIIREASMIIGNYFVYGLIVLGLLLLGETRNEKRLKIVISIFFAIIIGLFIKELLAHPRPCIGNEWCPYDNSFPSIHALAAFTLMCGFIKKKTYPFYLLFALFVAFSRLNLGVHVFQDIAAALPLALVSYYITDLIWKIGDNNG